MTPVTFFANSKKVFCFLFSYLPASAQFDYTFKLLKNIQSKVKRFPEAKMLLIHQLSWMIASRKFYFTCIVVFLVTESYFLIWSCLNAWFEAILYACLCMCVWSCADLPCALFFGLLFIWVLFQGCLLTQMSAKFPKFSGPVRSLVCSLVCSF